MWKFSLICVFVAVTGSNLMRYFALRLNMGRYFDVRDTVPRYKEVCSVMLKIYQNERKTTWKV